MSKVATISTTANDAIEYDHLIFNGKYDSRLVLTSWLYEDTISKFEVENRVMGLNLTLKKVRYKL